VRCALTLLLLAVCAVAPASAAARKAPGTIPAGKTVFVVGQSGVERADEFEAQSGIAPAGAMWYLGLYEDAAVIDGHLAAMKQAVAEHPGLVVNLGVSFGAISTPSPSYSAAIAAGAYDATIVKLATFLKELPTVAYLRLGYEFDLLGGQYGPPAVYRAAYRHIVDVLRAEDVRNAHYVWHSAGAFWRGTDPSLFAVMSGALAAPLHDALAPEQRDPQPITAFYPGRRYVDSFGISYWQDSCCFGESGPEARRVYEARTREILRQAQDLGLPIQIGESTPAYVGADSGAKSVAWLDRTFALIEEFDIRQWSLISIDWQEGGFFAAPFWNGYWPDARIHRYKATRERIAAGLADDRFLLRSPGLPRQLGYRPPRTAKRR
jgi:hypothetical protein